MASSVMPSPSPTPTPSPLAGQSAPLAVITSTDRTGAIVIATALGPAFALVSLLIRFYVRYQFSVNRFAWDDGFVVGAFVFSIFQNACVFLEAHKGLGNMQSAILPQALIGIQKAGYADDLLYVASVWLTKISMAFLFLRLSPKRGHEMASRVDLVVAAVTALASILIVALRCNLSEPWININSQDAQCAGLLARWEAVAAFDIFLELLIFATATYILQPLQMSIRKKFDILVLFASRLPLIIPIVLRLYYLAPALNSSDYTLNVTYAVICKQVEISYAIIATTIPCLRPFMVATATHYGGAAEGHRTKLGTYGNSGKSSTTGRSNSQEQNGGFHLSSLASRLTNNRNNPSDHLGSQSSQMKRVDSHGNHTASVVAGGNSWSRDVHDARSTESTEVIIRKEVRCTVEYDSSENIDGEPGQAY